MDIEICSSLITGNNPLHYRIHFLYKFELGLKDCTLVSVMEKADFPKWLQNQKNHHESMSENLLTSQAEIRHR